MGSRRWRSLVGRVAMLCVAVVFVTAATAAHSSPARADTLSWASGTAVPAPMNSDPAPDLVVTAISCPAAGICTAVGTYRDSSGETQGMLASESSGVWATATTAPLPFNPNTSNPNVSLTAVSCASAGNCAAVGSYVDLAGHTQGLLLIETNGTWAQGREVIHPQGVASVAANPQVDLTSVSCATATNCLVSGTYSDSYGYPQGMLETEINGTWSQTQKNGAWSYTGVQIGLPGDAATHPKVALDSVSCGAVGHCVAVGSYVNTAAAQEALVLTGTVTSGAWTFTPSAVSLPSGAAASPLASVDSVSCTASTECTAVGSYSDSSHHQQGLLVSEMGGAWQTATTAVPPTDATTNPDVSLTSVSCSSAGNCGAVGDYYTRSGNMQGLMLSASAGSWGAGAEPSIPIAAGSVTLTTVACFATSKCAATGNYEDDSFSSHPLLLSESTGATWTAGVEPALPYANPSPDANVESVACAAVGTCTAVADYTDEAGNQLAGAVNGTLTAAATPTISLSSAPPAVSETGIPLPTADFSASLSGGVNESGRVTFRVFGPQDSPPVSCVEGGTVIGTATVSGNGTYGPAQGFTPAAAGDYWWYASYGGDLGNTPAFTACDGSMSETVVQTPTLTVAAPSATSLGSVISSPSVTGALSQVAGGASGTVAFTVFGPEPTPPADCSVGGNLVGSATAQGNGLQSPGSDFTPGSVGDYWWYASYSGDGLDPAAASACGDQMAETVVKAETGLSESQPVATGTVAVPISASLSASLSGGVGATGTVTFSVFGPQASPPASCSAPTATVGTATVQANGTAAAAATFTPSAPGTYWWYASYSGDSDNYPSASACGAQMAQTIVSPQPVKTTTSPSTTTPTVTTTSPTPTPLPAATPRIAKVTTAGNVLKVTVTCHATSGQSCTGALKATTTESTAAGKTAKKTGRAKATKKVVTIATVTYKVGGGKTREVSIRLNKVGVQLLASRRKLPALLELREEHTTLSRNVTLRLPAPKKSRRSA